MFVIIALVEQGDNFLKFFQRPEVNLIEIGADHVKIRPAAGKIYGKYPEDFLKNGGRDE